MRTFDSQEASRRRAVLAIGNNVSDKKKKKGNANGNEHSIEFFFVVVVFGFSIKCKTFVVYKAPSLQQTIEEKKKERAEDTHKKKDI